MQGIMVRHYAKPELSGFIRISAGRPAQTDLFMKALQALSYLEPPGSPALPVGWTYSCQPCQLCQP